MAGKGRGWFGDSEGHARAGRKGGRARGKNSKTRKKAMTMQSIFAEKVQTDGAMSSVWFAATGSAVANEEREI